MPTYKSQTVVNNQPWLTSIPNNIFITEEGQSDDIRTIIEKFQRGQLPDSSSRQRSFVANVAVEDNKVNQQQLNELFDLPIFDDYDQFELADLQLHYNNDLQKRKIEFERSKKEIKEDKELKNDDHTEKVV